MWQSYYFYFSLTWVLSIDRIISALEASSDEYLLMHDLHNGIFSIHMHYHFMCQKDSSVISKGLSTDIGPDKMRLRLGSLRKFFAGKYSGDALDK